MIKSLRLWLLLAGIAFVFIIFFTLKMPADTFFWGQVDNAGHAPLFGILSLFILEIMLISRPSATGRRWFYYLLAFLITIFFGAATEYIQKYTHADPDIHDWFRDIAGATAFLAVFAIYDSKRISAHNFIGRFKFIIIIIAGLIILATWIPLAMVSGAYLYRNHEFPTLIEFNSYWDKQFIVGYDIQLEDVAPPTGWTNPPQGRVGKITFLPAQYPTLAIEQPYSNWTNREKLYINIYSDNDTTVSLVLRINDVHHNYSFDDRYNTDFKVNPGLNLIAIPLADVVRAPKSRPMNMKKITNLAIFAVNPPKPFTLYFGKFYLQ